MARRRSGPRIPRGVKLKEKGSLVQRWVLHKPSRSARPHYRRHWVFKDPDRVTMAEAPKGKWGKGRPYRTTSVYRDKEVGALISKEDLKAYLKKHPDYRSQVVREVRYISKVTGKPVTRDVVLRRAFVFHSRKTGARVDGNWAKRNRSKVVKRQVLRPRRWTDVAWREAHPKATEKSLRRLKRTLREHRDRGLDARKSPGLKRYFDWLRVHRPLMHTRLQHEGLTGGEIEPTSFEEACRARGLV